MPWTGRSVRCVPRRPFAHSLQLMRVVGNFWWLAPEVALGVQSGSVTQCIRESCLDCFGFLRKNRCGIKCLASFYFIFVIVTLIFFFFIFALVFDCFPSRSVEWLSAPERAPAPASVLNAVPSRSRLWSGQTEK